MAIVFLSYASTDRSIARSLYEELARLGISTFLDESSIKPGQVWSPEIKRQHSAAEWIVLLASQASNRSQYVQQEVGAAVFNNRKAFLPVLLDISADDLPGWSNQYQSFDLRQTNYENRTRKLRELAELIRRDIDVQKARPWDSIFTNNRAFDSEYRSRSLLEIPFVKTPEELFDILRLQQFDFDTVKSINDLLRLNKRVTKMLALAHEVVISEWSTSPLAAGILATLYSNNVASWSPKKSVLNKLADLCSGAIAENEWNQVSKVEPLAFALAAKGFRKIHRNLLERLIVSKQWREQDASRVRYYYGGAEIQISAIHRHWNDPFRTGLLKANDTARLMYLIENALNNNNPYSSKYHRLLVRMLNQHAVVLHDSGATALAKIVNQHSRGIKRN